MIEFLNKYFGIGSEITVPIIVSLIVFIIGGISKIALNSINSIISRNQLRKSFKNIINEVIEKCKNKASHLEIFYPTLSIENNDDWVMKFTRVTYLQLAFQQDINAIFYSYRIHFRFRCYQDFKFRAYNKIWSILENLRFYEERILLDLENTITKFNVHESKYYENLELLREENDKLLQPLVGKKIGDLNLPKNVHDYVIERDRIFVEWQAIGEPTRRLKTILYSKLVKPLYQLNLNNQDVELTISQNTILLAALHEYEQMEKIMTVGYKTFYEYYIAYKTSYRLLEKCLEIIK